MDEKAATDLFYKAATCKSLSDARTNLYLHPWQEIYEMLKKEIK
jgi:rhamnogalacturonyl hydrolase YesR